MTTPEKKILIISLTPVASSPRPLRQAHTFLEKGYTVYMAGYQGKDTPDKRWHFIPLPVFSKKKLINKLYGLMGTVPFLADFAYKRLFHLRILVEHLKKNPVDLILCHDYFTAPIGHALSKIFHCEYLIDVHEHALTENQPSRGLWQNIFWFLHKRYAHNLQKKYFPQVRALTTVSDGIADSLQKDYNLPKRPTVIHSTPFYQASPFRPLKENDPIRLLYHGGFAPDRGLEECIQAMALCDERFSLTLRGSGNPAYCKALYDLAQKSSARTRIHFEPSVPFQDIIPEAALFDIGLFIPPNISLQRKYVLPNKFFEYIMAGIALVVADLPEMAKIVRAHRLGVLVSSAQPEEIARSLNTLTWQTINTYKQHSLKTAKELCWEKEAEKLAPFFSLK